MPTYNPWTVGGIGSGTRCLGFLLCTWTVDDGRICVGRILRLEWGFVCKGTDSKTKSHALLDEFLTESVPEIDIAIKSIRTFDKMCVEMFIDETTPFT